MRQGQVTLGRAVEHALWNHEILLAEAPVGSGKSDAYSVPAVALALAAKAYKLDACRPAPYARLQQTVQTDGRPVRARIVISTAKKNLQQQLLTKDLPFIANRAGAPGLRFAVLKGKANYACPIRVEGIASEPLRDSGEKWLKHVPSGDFETPQTPPPPELRKYNASNCLGKSCKYAQDNSCGFWNARLDARDADIIVTNHASLAYDLRHGPGVLLPTYTALILDEAHAAADTFRDAFADDFSETDVGRFQQRATHQGINDFPSALLDAWAALFSKLPAEDGVELHPKLLDGAGGAVLAGLRTFIAAVKSKLTSYGWESRATWSPDEIKDQSVRGAVMDGLSLLSDVDKVSTAIKRFSEEGSNAVNVLHVGSHGQRRVAVQPINPGPLVGPKLQSIPSLILCSATLQVKGSFATVKHQLGLGYDVYRDAEGVEFKGRELKTLTLPTPFDYATQAVMYVPTHLPLPGGRGATMETYYAALAEECAALVDASDGNAFILCTSHADVEALYNRLMAMRIPQPLLRQQGDNNQLLHAFKQTPRSVLIATKAFWEGVDIPGQKLQLVIVTKLPFPRANDGLLKAQQKQMVDAYVKRGMSLSEARSEAFIRLQEGKMLLDLRQGAGRLIRSTTDKGLLAILDPRMFSGTSGEKAPPTQTAFRGYGIRAADAIGFKNVIYKRGDAINVLHRLRAYEASLANNSAPGADDV